MAVFKFRVTFEDYDEVYRDIEIKGSQTFLNFYNCIIESIGFDSSKKLASFFMSQDNWRKGEEIALEPEKGAAAMETAKVVNFINDPHQKIYFSFDKDRWCFYIELIKILKDDESLTYPRLVKKNGEAPKQFGATNLGKAGSDFDFLNQSQYDQGGEEGEPELEGEEVFEEEGGADGDGDEAVDEFGDGPEESFEQEEF